MSMVGPIGPGGWEHTAIGGNFWFNVKFWGALGTAAFLASLAYQDAESKYAEDASNAADAAIKDIGGFDYDKTGHYFYSTTDFGHTTLKSMVPFKDFNDRAFTFAARIEGCHFTISAYQTGGSHQEPANWQPTATYESLVADGTINNDCLYLDGHPR